MNLQSRFEPAEATEPDVAHVTTLLDSLAAKLPVLLGANLVGIYLHGSLTQRTFNPKRSDIDCVVATKRDLSDGQFKRFREWLAHRAKSNPWTRRLQMTFLIRDEVLTANSAECLYEDGKLTRLKSDGNPLIWMNVLKNGRVLFGPPPRTFVPPITRSILFRALEREVGYLRAELIEKPRSKWRDVPIFRAYAVMSVCRILYSLNSGTVVSKPRAAKWAMKHLPQKFRVIIAQALAHDGRRFPAPLPLAPIRQFVHFADARLQVVARLRSY